MSDGTLPPYNNFDEKCEGDDVNDMLIGLANTVKTVRLSLSPSRGASQPTSIDNDESAPQKPSLSSSNHVVVNSEALLDEYRQFESQHQAHQQGALVRSHRDSIAAVRAVVANSNAVTETGLGKRERGDALESVAGVGTAATTTNRSDPTSYDDEQRSALAKHDAEVRHWIMPCLSRTPNDDLTIACCVC